MVAVTKKNFIEQSNDFLSHLPTAAFVAVDEEMTGISVGGQWQNIPKDETPSERYPHLKQAPETYSIIQFGISLFHYNDSDRKQQQQQSESSNESDQPAADWSVRRYNFFAFPGKDSERSVVLNPSAVAFLNQHNISFDKWTKEGIPFQTESQAKDSLQSYTEKILDAEGKEHQAEKQPSIQDLSRRRVQLRRTEDIDFFSRTMANLRNWLDSSLTSVDENGIGQAQEDEGASYILPECNSFLRRALYECIGQEYPSLILEKVSGANSIKVWRLSDEEKERREKRLCREAWQNLIVEHVGLYRIFFALSQVSRGFDLELDSALLAPCLEDVDFHKESSLYRGAKNRKIPVIVHNGFMDLCFLMTHFVSNKLPDTLLDCKTLISNYFPVVYDTKILAVECSPIHQNGNSRLGPLFDRVSSQLEGQIIRSVPEPEEGEILSSEEHFADYDAYMTGVCFLGICQCINRMSELQGRGVKTDSEVGNLLHLLQPTDDLQVRKSFGRNLLFQMSMFTMDLESDDDPLCRGMDKCASFHVTDINPSITTRDIANSVSGLIDRAGRSVSYEITWVDDTTFIVAATYRPDVSSTNEPQGTDAVILEHGNLIFNALKARFTGTTVMSLEKHLDDRERRKKLLQPGIPVQTKPSLFSRLFGWARFGARSQPAAEDPPAKRRKLN
mmetsp:Transcript_8241/g.10790  ORF Transcript_8241/g.10790 Transcript_8241/m.10790 type:complete len:673 (+) Transcript_8241:348-2366(+)|eukprot:CAMPEP_0198142568 /NCGR_PEP_ID=MMETSP1443-20131203/5322_1 /TAXON_ID=186043 /ORGANISM="Entomoneis sp., Strain CCMP2396" /LENGTH=672 /DNA_ID=CAMNT_0043805613 /DNA_START=282 /DNA_END=2300 /DNA_ORIENTATION=+